VLGVELEIREIEKCGGYVLSCNCSERKFGVVEILK